VVVIFPSFFLPAVVFPFTVYQYTAMGTRGLAATSFSPSGPSLCRASEGPLLLGQCSVTASSELASKVVSLLVDVLGKNFTFFVSLPLAFAQKIAVVYDCPPPKLHFLHLLVNTQSFLFLLFALLTRSSFFLEKDAFNRLDCVRGVFRLDCLPLRSHSCTELLKESSSFTTLEPVKVNPRAFNLTHTLSSLLHPVYAVVECPPPSEVPGGGAFYRMISLTFFCVTCSFFPN